MIVEKLPLEIIQKILMYVEKKELQNLLYICKKWHHLVKAFYFERITWRTKEKIQWLKQHLAVINENKNDIPVFRKLPMTKRLHIYYDTDHQSIMVNGRYTSPSTQFTEKEFLYLLSLFPDLRFLDVMQSEHRGHYLKILRNAQPAELPPLLEEIVTDGDYLDERDGDPRIQKFATCNQFRQSLKYMTLSYFNDLIHGKSFLELLPEFKNLSTLRIDNYAQPDLTFFELLQACPSLSSLTYTSAFDVPQNTDHQLAHWIQDLDSQNSTISYYLCNLKKLNLSMPNLTAPYMEFFTSNCPENLNDLELQLTGTGMYRWVDSVTMNAALDFCKSLQKVTSIRLMFDRETVIDHRRIDSFYQILDALSGERDFKTRSAIQKDTDEINMFGVQIHASGSKLIYEYCFNFEEDGLIDENDTHPCPSALTLKQLAKVDKFDIWTEYENGDFASMQRRYLMHVQKYLPNLMQFQLDCGYANRFLEAKSLFSKDRSLGNMTHISMEGFEYLQDVMNDLATYLPRIEVLSFGISSSFRTQNEKIIFNMTHFENMHTLIIGIEYISHLKCDSIFLQYTDASEHTVHYLLKSKTRDGNISENHFESISSDIMQQIIEGKETRCTYTMHIEGSNQLKRIELRYHGATYASLDL